MAGKLKSSKPLGVSGKSKKEHQQSLKRTDSAVPSDHEGSDSEESGVDEEGMSMLMKALGKDGLDEIGKMQLELLGGEGSEGEDSNGENDGNGDEEGSSLEGASDDEGSEEVEDEESGNDDDEEDDHVGKQEGKQGKQVVINTDGVERDIQEGIQDDIALDDVDSVDEDVVPRQRIEIDNKIALERIRDTIKLDSTLPWTETLSVTYSETIQADAEDDLSRELAFYKQALHGANMARNLASRHNLQFTRPADYFAEMVKSDFHMERVRQRLLDEGATIKRGEEKRKEREGKKFGKQMQVEKLKERERSKKDMEERLKGLKRKRKDALVDPQADDGAFDVAVEDAISDRPAKRARDGAGRKTSRNARDAKFGFGGRGKRSKQNTRESTETFDFSSRGSKGARGGKTQGRMGRGGSKSSRGGTKRLGKSRRTSSRGK